ncbi:MAG: hypothetical protein LW823_01080 [Rickettsiales bacterium]|jgi:hypothetical protein|nr:hypothetical protein [Rickettsiales bacterium]
MKQSKTALDWPLKGVSPPATWGAHGEINALIIGKIEDLCSRLSNKKILPDKSINVLIGCDYELELKDIERITPEIEQAQQSLIEQAPKIRAFFEEKYKAEKKKSLRDIIANDIALVDQGDVRTLAIGKLHLDKQNALQYMGVYDNYPYIELRFTPKAPVEFINQIHETISGLESISKKYGFNLILRRPHIHLSAWHDGENLTAIDSPQKLELNQNVSAWTLKILHEGLPSFVVPEDATGNLRAGLGKTNCLRMCKDRYEQRLSKDYGTDHIALKILLLLSGLSKGLQPSCEAEMELSQVIPSRVVRGLHVSGAPDFLATALNTSTVDSENNIRVPEDYLDARAIRIRGALLGNDPMRELGSMKKPWDRENIPLLKLDSGEVIKPEEIMKHLTINSPQTGVIDLPNYSYTEKMKGDPIATCFDDIHVEQIFDSVQNDGYVTPSFLSSVERFSGSELLKEMWGNELHDSLIAAIKKSYLKSPAGERSLIQRP